MSMLPDIGPYATYIWASYSAAAVILIGMAVMSLHSHHKLKKDVARLRPNRGSK